MGQSPMVFKMYNLRRMLMGTEYFNGEELKELLNYYYGNIFVVDGKGKIIYANASAAESVGSTIDDITGKNCQEMEMEGYYDKSVALDAIRKKKRVLSVYKTRIGLNVVCSANPILDECGNVTRVVVFSQDEALMREIMNDVEEERKKNISIQQTLSYIQEKMACQNIVSSSPEMERLFKMLLNVARTDTTVTIYGESGTGKEVLANFVHQNSMRSNKPFIPINCAAIPAELMEAEFFGYEKGSFTGANREGKAGLFEMADHGTIFLDELGEMPLSLQSKLLRVLESGEVKRIGSSKTIKTDVRIIAATNRNLTKMVDEKTFREDLYYRLNVIPVNIPPLRERPEDIEALSEHFLNEFNRKYGRNVEISGDVLNKFKKYSWPGNIRELKNEIERYVVTEGQVSSVLNDNIRHSMTDVNIKFTNSNISKNITVKNIPLKEVMDRYEIEYIRHVIDDCEGVMTEAAKRLGIHRSALYKKIDKFKEKYDIKL